MPSSRHFIFNSILSKLAGLSPCGGCRCIAFSRRARRPRRAAYPRWFPSGGTAFLPAQKSGGKRRGKGGFRVSPFANPLKRRKGPAGPLCTPGMPASKPQRGIQRGRARPLGRRGMGFQRENRHRKRCSLWHVFAYFRRVAKVGRAAARNLPPAGEALISQSNFRRSFLRAGRNPSAPAGWGRGRPDGRDAASRLHPPR